MKLLARVEPGTLLVLSGDATAIDGYPPVDSVIVRARNTATNAPAVELEADLADAAWTVSWRPASPGTWRVTVEARAGGLAARSISARVEVATPTV